MCPNKLGKGDNIDKTQKKCIFCQGTGMSKEHFWPDWLRNHIYTSINDKHTSEFHISEGKNPSVLTRKDERSGHLITKKFRVVCVECNTGWMSKLEEKMKPIILDIINSKTVSLDKTKLEELSRWIVMKVIVAEQSEENTQVTPEMDRIHFYRDIKIPDYFRIYIGKHTTPHNSAYLRHSVTLALSKTGPITALNGMKRNTQTVSFLLGPIFIYVIACREEGCKVWRYFKLNQLKCIFPNTKNIFNSRTLKIINQRRMAIIANSLNDLTSSSIVKYGGSRPNE